MNNSKNQNSDWYVPPGVWAMLCLFLPMLTLSLLGSIIASLFRASEGDPTILQLAISLAGIGVILLFFSRLPLYRQRRFFTFGPGALDQRYRRLYRWAYGFIGSGAVLLVLLRLVVS